MSGANEDAAATVPLLRHGAFLRFLYVRVAATVALQSQAVAVGWQMYQLTRDPFDLGLVGLVQFIPAFGLFLATGHAADRYDRRTVTAIAQLVQAVPTAILAVAAASGRLSAGLILAVVFAVGTGRAFEQPSLQSILPNIVPASVLPRAIAASTSASQTAIVAGPALGGVLIAVSPTLVFAACAFLWLTCAVAMRGIAMPRMIGSRQPIDLKTLLGGFTYIARHRVVLGAILLDLFAVLCGNAMALLPVFARDIFMSGPLSYGALRAAPAAGAFGMALVLTRWPITRRVGRAMFVSVIVFGIGTILLALAPSLAFAIAVMIVVGAADVVSVVIRQTLVQIHTPDAMRGRVYAVSSLFTITSNQLGDFRAGAAATLFGTVPSVVIGGLSTLAVAAIARLLFRELARADEYGPQKV